jgi:uncharacterized protein YndB with AHSA1/START domain
VSDERDPVDAGSLVLVVRRKINATAGRLFEAWTRPEQLRSWWGPRPVRCVEAQVNLRVGGHYRIVNAVPNGVDIVITGVFARIDAPRKLVYSWNVSPGGGEPELVTVLRSNRRRQHGGHRHPRADRESSIARLPPGGLGGLSDRARQLPLSGRAIGPRSNVSIWGVGVAVSPGIETGGWTQRRAISPHFRVSDRVGLRFFAIGFCRDGGSHIPHVGPVSVGHWLAARMDISGSMRLQAD